MIVAEKGLVLFHDGGAFTWLPYSDITGWERLYKEPIVSRSLIVKTRSGERVELPFDRGGAFAFVQFLGNVIDAIKAQQP
jgi:hypothetical protein